ncbi:MAG TPA: hypothetical protein PLL09_09765 [Flavobacterium sp.]|uniref:hypothetical protein n=2 Tax=Flavobacterium TaxID=237 RepID=UPI0025BF5867|nr:MULTISPECIES: hypothetical protein [unclassified Flavobacterium]HRE78095.1 hypothetical protein [Flavobacterium sp.]
MIQKLLFFLILVVSIHLFAQPLSGTYTIGGTSPDYPTVVLAVAALETNGISGPVTFNIRSGNYTSQTFTLTEIAGQSPLNTITFQSETGNPGDVTFISTTFKFTQGSQYITIKNLGFSGGSRKIEILGSSFVANFNVLNCIFTNTINLASGSLSDSTFYSQVTQVSVSHGYNIIINGNTFNNAGVAVGKSGQLTDNFTFSNNIINGGIMPISIYQGRNVTISGNVYTGEIRRNIMSVTSVDGNLIISGNRFHASTTSTDVILSRITGNNTTGTNLNMFNNFFSMSKELEINGFYDTNIRFNSFSSSNSICLSITQSYNLNAYNIYNNIFKNPHNKESIRAHMQVTLDRINSNYNAFSNEAMIFYRYFTGETGSTTLNFTDWQALSGEDMNSVISGNVFASEPDLHTPNSLVINGAGLPIAGIMTDIDGEPRDMSNPDIGADEFDINPTTFRDLGITLVAPIGNCDNSPIQISVTNHSQFAITGFEIECAINNHRGNINYYSNTLESGEAVTFDVTGCSITPNTWYEELEVKVATTTGNLDNNFANDRIIFENLFQYGPFEIEFEQSDCDSSTDLYIPEFFGATQLWSTGEITPLITVQNPGTYSVTITNISGCIITKYITLN